MEDTLTHFDEHGRARMVDVSPKEDTQREAIARGQIKMKSLTLEVIKEGRVEKGDVLGVARVAAIMAAKKTWNIIPMCHPLFITGCEIDFIMENDHTIIIEAKVKTSGKTGVEMEALTAVSAAALTIYDMCKAIDKGMIIEDIHLAHKSGGKSGIWNCKR